MTFDVNRFRVKFRGRLNQPHRVEGRGERTTQEQTNKREKRGKKRESIGDVLSQGHQYLHLRERNAGLGGGEKKSICVRAQTGDPIFQ